jgi:hypothetical protein
MHMNSNTLEEQSIVMFSHCIMANVYPHAIFLVLREHVCLGRSIFDTLESIKCQKKAFIPLMLWKSETRVSVCANHLQCLYNVMVKKLRQHSKHLYYITPFFVTM